MVQQVDKLNAPYVPDICLYLGGKYIKYDKISYLPEGYDYLEITTYEDIMEYDRRVFIRGLKKGE